MSGAICLRWSASLRVAASSTLNAGASQTRRYASKQILENEAATSEFLSKPSWSVRSLLPSSSDAASTPTITSKQLSHLLRLSALPQPKDAAEEAKMISTLESQLHFVRDIQRVDTTGVEPLQAIREETEKGLEEHTIGLEMLKNALAQEEVKGRMKRPRRKEGLPNKMSYEWNSLATANKTVGDYFVVNSSKE